MNDLWIIIALYAFGLAFLLADLFLPSHLLLSAAGVVSLVVAIALSFRHGPVAGWSGVGVSAVVLPSLAYFTIKYWRHTPIGRRTAPPNPVLTANDVGVPVERMQALVWQPGTAVSSLRPIGICNFNGARVSCLADTGLIDAGERVRAIGISGANLIVTRDDERESR